MIKGGNWRVYLAGGGRYPATHILSPTIKLLQLTVGLSASRKLYSSPFACATCQQPSPGFTVYIFVQQILLAAHGGGGGEDIGSAPPVHGGVSLLYMEGKL